MNETNLWYKKIEQTIEREAESISRRDYKFYHVSRFLRVAQRLIEHEEQCVKCYEMKSQIEDIAENLSERINGTMHERKAYEQAMDFIINHLNRKHHMHPKNYFASAYAFIGMFAGAILGIAVFWLIDFELIKIGILAGWAAGLMVGRYYGHRKDKIIEKENRDY